MMIGTKLEYCLSDILLGDIDVNDVYVIIADNQFEFNNMNTVSHWWDRQMDPMTSHLSRGRNSLHLFGFEECWIRIQNLVEDGKIAFRNETLPTKLIEIMDQSKGEHWFEINLREKDMTPAVKMAWDHYRMLAGLCK